MNGEIEITIKRIVNIEYMIKHMTDFIRYNSECSKKEVDMFLESAVGVIEYLNEENKRLQSLVNQQSKMLNLKKETEPTDIKKEALKKECFGCHINGDGKCNLCVDEKECMTETNPMKAEKKCFGCFDGNDIECCTCDDMKQCEEETNRKPDCFGNYEEEDGWDDSCDECMYAKECKKSFINKKKNKERA